VRVKLGGVNRMPCGLSWERNDYGSLDLEWTVEVVIEICGFVCWSGIGGWF
jgi:hypothetical protein